MPVPNRSPSKPAPTRSARLGRVAFTVIVIGGLAAAARSRLVSSPAATDKRASGTADQLATCLFGDPPPNDDAALLEVRGVQLEVMSETPQHAELGWPTRCAPLARALSEEERPHPRSASLTASAAKLALALEDRTSRAGDWSQPLLAWLKDERATGRSLRRVAEVQGPPQPVTAWSVDSLDRSARLWPRPISLSSLRFQPFFDDSLAFVIDAESPEARPTYCVFAPEPPRSGLVCTAIEGAARAGNEALRAPTTRDPDAPAVVFAGEDGVDGAFSVTTGLRLELPPHFDAFGSFALGSGDVDLVGESGAYPVVRLVHRSAAGAVTDTPVVALSPREAEGAFYNVGFFWGYLVTKGAVRGQAGLRLRVGEVKNGAVLPAVDVGPVGQVSRDPRGRERQLEGCRADGALSLRVKGWDTEYFSFHDGGRWTSPVQGAAVTGLFTCHGAEAVVVDERGHVEEGRYEPRVRELRCTAAGCRETNVETREVFAGNRDTTPEEARDVAVAPLRDGLLLVWSAGDAGGLRMRLGRTSEIAKGREVVLFDDHLEGGRRRVDSTLVELRLRPVGGGVLLFLDTTAGVFVYRVDEAGKAAAVRVSGP